MQQFAKEKLKKCIYDIDIKTLFEETGSNHVWNKFSVNSNALSKYEQSQFSPMLLAAFQNMHQQSKTFKWNGNIVISSQKLLQDTTNWAHISKLC